MVPVEGTGMQSRSLLEGLASGVSHSLLTPGPQCGSHMRHPGRMSVYMLWAVLVFRESDKRVPRSDGHVQE